MDPREREAEERRQSPVTDTPESSTATNGAGGKGGGSGAPPPAVEVGGMGMGRGGGGAPLSLKNLRTFKSFSSHPFRLYYAAMLGQMAAMNMQMFARTLLVFRLTESATALGVMAMANAVPMLFFSLFGGVMAERVQKKYVLIWGQAASAVVALGVALSLSFGYMSVENPYSWWILIVASLFQGTIMGLMMPSRQAIIADIVGGEQLMNAVALNTLGMNSLRLLAPAFAGYLVDTFDVFGSGGGIGGFASVYYVMTVMYIVAVGFIMLMPKVGTISLQGRGALADVIDGFKYVRRDPTILVLLIITLLTVLFSMSYMFLLPVFTEKVWDVSASKLGLLMSVSGVGAMAGSILLASLPNKKRGMMLMVGALILGVALTAFSFSPSYNVALITIVFVGVGQTARMTLSNTLLQYYVLDEYRGRVMSMMMMEFGLTSFIVGITGWMVDIIGVRGGYDGVQWVVGGLAFFLVLLSVYVLAFVPRIRQLD